MKRKDFRAASGLLLAAMFMVGAMCALAYGAGGNLLLNGDFEQGAAHWNLEGEGGKPGGEIVREPDGNRVLHGAEGRHLLARLEGEGVAGLRDMAGAVVTLSYRVRGDQYAHPRVMLRYRNADGEEASFVFVSRPSARVRVGIGRVVPVSQDWAGAERTRRLPDDMAAPIALEVYSCDGQREIFYDDFHLAPTGWSPEAVRESSRAIEDPSWREMTFESVDEILEFANTCNFLTAEWSRALSDLYGARRAADLLGDAAFADRASRLEEALDGYRDELTALRELYIAVVSERYGEEAENRIFTPKNPFGFYNREVEPGVSGAEAMVRVMDRKSDKAPLKEFEAKLEGIRSEAAELRSEIRAHAAEHLGWDPAPVPPHERPERTFDDAGRPKHISFGMRGRGWYSLFAHQWLQPLETTGNFDPVVDIREGRFVDEGPRGLERRYARYRPYGAKLYARPYLMEMASWMDQNILAEWMRDPENHFEWTDAGEAVAPREHPRTENRMIGGWFQYHNPEVMAAVEEHMEAYSRLCKQHEDLVSWMMTVGEQAFTRVGAYSPRAQQAFRARLAEKFGDVGALNRAWGAEYGSFGDIPLPSRERLGASRQEDLPLIYEYRAFLKDYDATVAERAYAAMKRGSNMPVGASIATNFMNGLPFSDSSHYNWDSLRHAHATDILLHHHCYEGGPRQDAANVYHQSLARYAGGKKTGSDEYYPANRVAQSWNWQEDPFIIYTHTKQHVWKDLAADYALLHSWFTIDVRNRRRESYREGSYRLRSGLTLFEEYYTAFSHIQQRLADGAHDALFETRKVLPEVAVLSPWDASLVSWPGGRIMHEGFLSHNFMVEHQWEYEYVPEQLVTSGEETLADFKALVAPYALWAREDTQRRLLRWVEEGGTLISVGPYGHWDEYGRESGVLMEACFGALPLEAARRRNGWTFGLTEDGLAAARGVDPSVAVEDARAGRVGMLSARRGRGRVYLLTHPGLGGLRPEARRILNDAIMDAVGFPPAYGARRNFYLYLREHPETLERYLLAINRDKRERREDAVTVLGEYPRPVELTVPGGFPLAAEVGAGHTTLQLSLAPGEAAIVRLGDYDRARAEQAKALLSTRRGLGEMEEIRRVLDGLEPDGEIAFARAMTLRNLALEKMETQQFGAALDWANKAAEFAGMAPPARAAEAYESAYAPDWEGVPWRGLGESRFKTRWDERNLYFLAELQTDEIVNPSLPPTLWRGDNVEIYLNVLNVEGHREVREGALDYQYCVSATGLAQVFGGRFPASPESSAKVQAEQIEGGYRLEIAIPHAETMLAPVDGYELGFNLRHSDFEPRPDRPAQPRQIKDTILQPTGVALHMDTQGWTTLRLTGGPESLRPAPEHHEAEGRVVVRGVGWTLESLARALDDPALLRFDEEGAVLGADIVLADFAEMALGMNVRAADGKAGLRIGAGEGARIEIRRDTDLLGVDLTPAAARRLWSVDGVELRVMQEIEVLVTDRNGRPLPHVVPGVIGEREKDRSVAFTYETVPVDDRGRATFAAPATVIRVDGAAGEPETGRYIVTFEARETPQQCLIEEPVVPSEKREYKVVFPHGYHEQN